MTAQVVTEPAAALTRGMTVVVGDSFASEELHGKKMLIASKGTVGCKGKDCGSDCVGLALFVAAPEDYVEVPSADHPWRTGTVKICVTQLLDKKKQPLIQSIDLSAVKAEAPKRKPGRPRKEAPAPEGEPVVKKRRGRPPKSASAPAPAPVAEAHAETNGNGNGGCSAPSCELPASVDHIQVGPPSVSWEDLYSAGQRGDHEMVSRYALMLFNRVGYLEPRLISALEQLVALQAK